MTQDEVNAALSQSAEQVAQDISALPTETINLISISLAAFNGGIMRDNTTNWYAACTLLSEAVTLASKFNPG